MTIVTESEREVLRPDGVVTHTFILKVASRCNLKCSYCYMYEMGDESYKKQPRLMSDEVCEAALDRIRNYCVQHGLADVHIIFHGGEPLLAGPEFYRRFVALSQRVLKPQVSPFFSLQTNGTLIDADWLALFSELDIGFGISLDGTEEAHDTYRVDKLGQGSYKRVRRAIEQALGASDSKSLFGSVLTVINLQVDPLDIYKEYKELGVQGCDLLLPDANHDQPPPNPPGSGASDTPYADWLIRLFDAWFRAEDVDFSIRIFEDVMQLVFAPGLGGDSLGGGENGVLVIETDGGIEPVDVLKICGDGFTKLGLNVLRDPIQAISGNELVSLYQEGGQHLCRTCEACPIVAVCGGGYLPHRYRAGSSFDNPSVYCRDLARLITHVQGRMVDTIPAALRTRLQLRKYRFEDVLRHLREVKPSSGGAA